MDKTAIKNFAIAARRNLIKAVRQKAYDIGIFEDKAAPITEVQGGYIYNGVSYDRTQSEQRKRLVSAIDNHADGKGYAHGYNQVMEEAAYTWFNRLIALRFMELNGYLPSNIRILSSEIEGRLEPDCIREAEHLDFVDMSIVNELKDNADKLYRYILIAQCNALSNILSKMFQKIADYTELLLPDRLYSKAGYIVYDLVHDIAEKDFREQVEIIGWLYQYYITEINELVYDGSMSKSRISKELLPAATQLFTPDWAVKYMVDNSLGKLWLDSGTDNRLKASLKYYLENEEIKGETIKLSPTQITFFDPCMGSGHILAYAFDLFYKIYELNGYTAREIPSLILTNNIYGLDIDDRAGQLAYFALMMKARSYDRRFFQQENIPQPKVYAISESDGIKTAEFSNLPHDIKADIDYLIGLFADAKEYGSIIKIDRDIDYYTLIEAVKNYTLPAQLTLESIGFEERKSLLLAIIEIAQTLTQKYDVVVTNPPYLGSSRMSATLAEHIAKAFPDVKSDFSMVFYQKAIDDFVKPNGYISFITTNSWMFLKSFEKIRSRAIIELEFESLVDYGTELFDGKVGHNPIVSWVNKKCKPTKKMLALRLVDYCYSRRGEKEPEFFNPKNRYVADQKNFVKIPGIPVAYWVSENFIFNFSKGEYIGSFCKVSEGIKTGDNDRFLKLWHEINKLQFSFGLKSQGVKWYPHHKGGKYKKWYGNLEWAINWENNGSEIQASKNSGLQGKDFYFSKIAGWSKVGSKGNPIRLYEKNVLFDSGAPAIHHHTMLEYITGLLNSTVGEKYLRFSNPSLNMQVGNVKNVPVITSDKYKYTIISLVTENIAISKTDWDSFETSWDFKTHPLIGFKGNYEEAEPLLVADGLIEGTVVTEWSKVSAPIAQCFDAWERFTDEQFSTLKANETELNRIFIDIYGLQDELTPDVADKDVTIRRADLARDVRSFISYAVGCMFGRYSLDEDGLVFAGGTFDINRYKTFIPEKENIIPITTEDYHLDNDIVARFIEFVKTVYGEQTLEENLQFIANALYPNADGTERAKIRRYFVNDFYKDHVKIYQKKPIYWLFDSNGCSDSGKQDAFKALIYLHRYDKYTAARVRVDYLHRLQAIYNGEINRCNTLIEMTTDAREIAAYKKQIETLQKKLTECRAYDPAIAHLAHKALDLDLDDGVTVNYAKFQGVEVELGGSKGTAKVDLLGKI